MDELIAKLVVAVVAPVALMAVSGVRAWVGRLRLDPPPERDDGVRVVHLSTDQVVHPSERRVKRRRRRAWLVIALLGLAATWNVATVSAKDAWLTVLLLCELVFVGAVQLPALRRTAVDEPHHLFELSVRVSGSLEAVSIRVRRAFLEMGALGTVATSIERGPDWFEVDGGVGSWGIDGDAGYRVRARVACADDACDVTVSGMNYVPALTESFRNQRNVAIIVRALVA